MVEPGRTPRFSPVLFAVLYLLLWLSRVKVLYSDYTGEIRITIGPARFMVIEWFP